MPDLIRLDKGIYLWYQYPPYVLMIPFIGKTEHTSFENKEEVELYNRALIKLDEFIKKEK